MKDYDLLTYMGVLVQVAERNGHTTENGRSSTMPPVFSSTPVLQQQQQSFFQAFQARYGHDSYRACRSTMGW